MVSAGYIHSAAAAAPTRYEEVDLSSKTSRLRVSVEATVFRVIGGSSILVLCASALLASSTVNELVATSVPVLALMALHFKRIQFEAQFWDSQSSQRFVVESNAWLAALVASLPVAEPILVRRGAMRPVLYCANEGLAREHIRQRVTPHPRHPNGYLRGDPPVCSDDPVNPPQAVWEMIRQHYTDNQLAARMQRLTLLNDTDNEIVAWFIVAIATVGYFGARCVAGGHVFHHVSFWCGVVFLNCLAFSSSWKPDPVLGIARFLCCASDGSSIFTLIGATYGLTWAAVPLPSAVAACAWWCLCGAAGNVLFALTIAIRFELLRPLSMPLPQTLRVVRSALVSAVILSFDRLNMMWTLDNCVGTRLGLLQIARLADTAIRHAPVDIGQSVKLATCKFFENEVVAKSKPANPWQSKWLLLLNGSVHGRTYPTVWLTFYVLCQTPALLLPVVVLVSSLASAKGDSCPTILLLLSAISVALMAALVVVSGRRIRTLLSLPVIPAGTSRLSTMEEFNRCEKYVALLSQFVLPTMADALLRGVPLPPAVLPADVVEHAVAPFVAPDVLDELGAAAASELRGQITRGK